MTIEPADGVTNPILDGDGTSGGTCQTTCTGPVLTIANESATISNITIQNGDNTTGSGLGGAIEAYGGTLTVSGTTFTGNTASYGGAINSADGDNRGVGTLALSDSTFSHNTAHDGDGGAIDASGGGGTGTLTVTARPSPTTAPTVPEWTRVTAGPSTPRTWLGRLQGPSATASVSTSTFTGNLASEDGAAIDNADLGGTGHLTVTDSTFSGNTSTFDGGAIASNDTGAVNSTPDRVGVELRRQYRPTPMAVALTAATTAAPAPPSR